MSMPAVSCRSHLHAPARQKTLLVRPGAALGVRAVKWAVKAKLAKATGEKAQILVGVGARATGVKPVLVEVHPGKRGFAPSMSRECVPRVMHVLSPMDTTSSRRKREFSQRTSLQMVHGGVPCLVVTGTAGLLSRQGCAHTFSRARVGKAAAATLHMAPTS